MLGTSSTSQHGVKLGKVSFKPYDTGRRGVTNRRAYLAGSLRAEVARPEPIKLLKNVRSLFAAPLDQTVSLSHPLAP
jgi:hypothetical protein